MTKKIASFIRMRLISFKYAFIGLWDMLTTEPNAWVHGTVTIFVLFLCWWLNVSWDELALVVLAIVAVWLAEVFNTVLELVMDYVSSKQYSPLVKRAKDISAAGVLVAPIGAVVVGLSVLGPPFFERVSELFGL